MRSRVVCFLLVFSTECFAESLPTAADVPRLRAEGPIAVNRLIARRAQMLTAADALADGPEKEAAEERIADFEAIIDAVAAAKYAHRSGLYWYTDEAAARQAAVAAKKPLLTLRLLGNLNEELSCANSRFFRLLLYCDPEVRRVLHDRFILHWKSLRPVPIITIDFGNGRKIERTITGNSIHYVALTDGTVVDAFPGLYAPDVFYDRLVTAADMAEELERQPAARRQKTITTYFVEENRKLDIAWERDVGAWQKKYHPKRLELAELPTGDCPVLQNPQEFWTQFGELHPEFSRLHTATEKVVIAESENMRARVAEHDRGGFTPNLDFAFTKNGTSERIDPIIRNLRSTLAADTARNEYVNRRNILGNILSVGGLLGVEAVNAEVYDTLFVAPLDDPYMGLAPPDVFSCIPRDGGIAGKRTPRLPRDASSAAPATVPSPASVNNK